MTRQKILITGASVRPGRGHGPGCSPPRAATWRCAPAAPTGSTSSRPSCSSGIPGITDRRSPHSTSTTTSRSRKSSVSSPTISPDSTASSSTPASARGLPRPAATTPGEQGDQRPTPSCGAGADRDGVEIFKAAGGGHLVLVSSVLGQQGRAGSARPPTPRARPGCRRWASRCAPNTPNGPIKVTVLEPGYIESEMTGQVASTTLLMVDNETGVKAMVDAIERETRPGRRADRGRGRRWCSSCGSCHRGLHAVLLRLPEGLTASRFVVAELDMNAKLTKMTPLLFAGAAAAAIAAAPVAGAQPAAPSAVLSTPTARRARAPEPLVPAAPQSPFQADRLVRPGLKVPAA